MFISLVLQTDLQTHVSARDVVSCFQKQINPCSNPSTFTSLNPGPNSKPSPNHTIGSKTITRRGDQSSEKGAEAVEKPMQLHPDSSQVGGNLYCYLFSHTHHSTTDTLHCMWSRAEFKIRNAVVLRYIDSLNSACTVLLYTISNTYKHKTHPYKLIMTSQVDFAPLQLDKEWWLYWVFSETKKERDKNWKIILLLLWQWYFYLLLSGYVAFLVHLRVVCFWQHKSS